jgi:hypothetical protein
MNFRIGTKVPEDHDADHPNWSGVRTAAGQAKFTPPVKLLLKSIYTGVDARYRKAGQFCSAL